MGMDLTGAGGYFRWNNADWLDLLEYARAFGWQPSGTGPPRGVRKAEWPAGPYHSNNGQRVYARDARAMADALERALTAFRAQKCPALTRRADKTDRLAAQLLGRKPPGRKRLPVPAWTPDDAAEVRQFIRFCRAGSFRLD